MCFLWEEEEEDPVGIISLKHNAIGDLVAMFRRIFSGFSTALKTGVSRKCLLRCHSNAATILQPDMQIRIIPALEDNYMYLLIDEATKQCAAIDPVEPPKILTILAEESLQLTAVLTTHHLWDHTGGNIEMSQKVSGIKVYGGDARIDALTNKVKHGDKLKLGQLCIKCLFHPSTTSGHICYFVESNQNHPPSAFVGDTLFVGGCGAFSESTAKDVFHALIEILGQLPGNTRVFCGHEFTVKNLMFAAHVEPKSKAVKDKMAWAKYKRGIKDPTVPSTIDDEKQYNPFMRVMAESVQKHCGRSDPVKVIEFLRIEKDDYKLTAE